jgi:hypothetical protein
MGRRDTTTVALGEQYLEQLEMKTTWFRSGCAHTKDSAPREHFSHLDVRQRNAQQHRLLVLGSRGCSVGVVAKRRADVDIAACASQQGTNR